jgi:hypothetical protein
MDWHCQVEAAKGDLSYVARVVRRSRRVTENARKSSLSVGVELSAVACQSSCNNNDFKDDEASKLQIELWNRVGGLIDSNDGRKLPLTISTALAHFSPRQAKCHML